MAHEIRGPLCAVALSSELLLDDIDTLTPEQVRILAQRIHRGTVWLQGLIENILCDVAIREGRLDLSEEEIQVGELMSEVQDLLAPLFAARGQTLQLVPDADVELIIGDRRRLSQVLVNLLLNASKFSASDTEITVTAHITDESVRFEVADRGCGLDAEAEVLFERFFRSPRARHAGIVGTGLGLAIVKAVVAAHGGSVGAENRQSGGARFWFVLPTTAIQTGNQGEAQ